MLCFNVSMHVETIIEAKSRQKEIFLLPHITEMFHSIQTKAF